MTTIYYLRQLPKQTSDYVYVLRNEQLYIRVDDEYLPKLYLTFDDVRRITGWPRSKIRFYTNVGRRPRLSVPQFLKIYNVYENQDHQF